MDKPIVIVYSTVDGHTLKICRVLADCLIEKHFDVQMFSIDQFKKQISGFSCVIIGASVRYGKHHRLIKEFILKNREELRTVKTAFFSVNLVARKEEKSRPENNPYLIKFLKEIDWKPDIAGVFAGQLDYSRYSFLDKLMIKLIMKLTHGPTKTKSPIVYTNWELVQQFAEKLG